MQQPWYSLFKPEHEAIGFSTLPERRVGYRTRRREPIFELIRRLAPATALFIFMAGAIAGFVINSVRQATAHEERITAMNARLAVIEGTMRQLRPARELVSRDEFVEYQKRADMVQATIAASLYSVREDARAARGKQ